MSTREGRRIALFFSGRKHGGENLKELLLRSAANLDDVDAVHERCLQQGIEVAYPPTDQPWNVREMHVRHPDGPCQS